ncbi:MAG: hypothetical protein LCI00_13400 [Chloroflexi bacterium]|nr:hypothetical protein [Chloroflexota bacterium]MCC6892342.1 hypothetical protein [Anaerolineae bacterium]
MPTPAYSQSPLVKKLAIKPNTSIHVLNPIAGFREMLGELPTGTVYDAHFDDTYDWLAVFAKTEGELDGLIEAIKQHLKPTGTLWVAIPRAKNPKFNRSTLIASRERYGFEIVSNAVINNDWTAYRYKWPVTG